MSLKYNIFETIKLLDTVLKNSMFIAIILSVVLLGIIFFINRKSKLNFKIILSINILLIIAIGYYYIKDIITFKFQNSINNIYFYFFNSIIFLLLITFEFYKKNQNKKSYVFYLISLINLLYSLYMTKYLYNNDLLVIANIFPMIKFGNIIYFIYYIYVFFTKLKLFFDKKK